MLSPISRARRAPPAGLASGGASPELGLWAGNQTCRIRPQPPAHVSAGEESAREPTSDTHFLGTHGVSLWECGDAKPSQGPLEPGALRAELCLGGQATALTDLSLLEPLAVCNPPPPKPSPTTPGTYVPRQGRIGAEARKAPVASPRLAQTAPSWGGRLKARQVWARRAPGRAASRQKLCQIGALSRARALPYWRRT